MRICFIYHGSEFPPAERIEKQARSLSQAGHTVFLACNNYGEFEKHTEQVGEVAVRRLRPTFAWEVINRVLKFPIFCNPLWLIQLYGILRKNQIDALQVVDVPLAPAALLFGKLFRIPVIYDMWENYPAALKTFAEGNWKTRLFKNYRVASWVERFSTVRADHVFVVVEEQRERLLSLGVSAERISVIGNTVELEHFVGFGTDSETALHQHAESFKLFFVGNITRDRGLDQVVRALPLIIPQISNCKLFIGGSGEFLADIQKLVKELKVSDSVEFLGYLPFSEIPSHIAASDLCLIPHIDTEQMQTTVPNKLFQYMVFGKPVLVSSVRPLARIVRECSSGYVYEVDNVESLAKTVIDAAKDDKLSWHGEQGRKAVEEIYNWDETAKELISVYENLN